MSIRDARRDAAIERMADHVLRHGLAGASLRPLAAAAGTSDRMLLYYFADKDEILAATLEHLARRLAERLDEVVRPGSRFTAAILLQELWVATRMPALQPFMHLWLELAGRAARSEQPHRAVAGRIADGFLSWIADHLDVADGERAHASALLLATLEGLTLMDAIGRPEIAENAASDEAGTWSLL